VAFLAGGPAVVSYEAQAAMWLEGLARGPAEPYDFGFEGAEIDTRPLILGVWEDAQRGRPAEIISARFHATLAEVIAATCERISGPRDVALTGGVFCNLALLEGTSRALELRGFRPWAHRRVPSNDGGLSLGQLAVAAALDHEQGRAA
jgi:hydrogenase maturation protein HypF